MSNTVSKSPKREGVIFLGKEQDGFVNVEAAEGKAWIKKILVTR